MVHIAMSIDFSLEKEEYDFYLATLILSILENTNEHCTFHVFFIGKLPSNLKMNLDNLISNSESKILYHNLVIDLIFLNLPHIKLWSPVIVNKFYFADYLKEVDKVIFFDIDIVLKRDIKVLWDIDVNDYCIAGVQYPDMENMCKEFNQYEIDCNSSNIYANRVNGGMLIFNLKKIRQQYNILEEAKNFVKRYPDIKGIDEVFFNHIFRNQTLLLDMGFQYFCGRMDQLTFEEESFEMQEKIVCFHFAGERKPLSYLNGAADYWFWKYFCKTPYFSEELFQKYFTRIGKKEADLKRARIHIRNFYETMKEKKKLAIFGTGMFAKKLYNYFWQRDNDIVYFVDNSIQEQGNLLYGIPIISPEELKHSKSIIILVAVRENNGNVFVKKQLKNMGFIEEKEFFDGKIIFDDIDSIMS